MNKKAIVVTSFGTSYLDSLVKNIESVENIISERFSDEYDIFRAFTSQIIINKLRDKKNITVKNLRQVLRELSDNNYEEVYLQVTLIMNGEEYDKISTIVEEYKDFFKVLKIGTPLLHSTDDYKKVASILAANTENFVGESKAVIFMGHGTEHFANSAYACLDYNLKLQASENYFVATVEGFPSIEDAIKMIKRKKIEKITLIPFMLVAGDHANNDMAGDEEDSWKNILEKEGYEVGYELKGLGEYQEIRGLYLNHVEDMIK